MEKDLFLILKTQYFREIEDGIKTSEYRLLTQYWLNRLSHDYKYVIFQLGYAKNAPRIRKKIANISSKTIKHEFFGDNPVDVFEINFENNGKI